MNSDDKRKVKIGILIALFTVVLYLGLQHMDVVVKMAGFLVSLVSPFIYGVCIAFVLNLLMKLLETKVFKKLNEKRNPKWEKARRPVCLAITILLFLGFLTALVYFLIPQLALSVKTLVNNIPTYLESLQTWANGFLAQIGVSTNINEAITGFLTQFSDSILTYLGDMVPKVVQTTVDVTSGIFNAFFGFVIAIYMLASKEALLRGCRRVLYAYLPLRGADYCTHAYRVVKQRFTGFVPGQLTEAVILGTLCFIGMTIFRMPYALLISIIIGITNIVPIIGPILGTIPGALIMLMIEPMQAVWFVLFIVILQQIESNLIYPRVVGDSLGLPGIWVMFSVLVGGGLFGLPGVLLGVPCFSVIYTLFAESVGKRLKERKLS